MSTNQISVFLENRPGALAEFTKVLEAHHIDMRAMCMADAQDFGILRIIVDDVDETQKILKEAGYIAQITKVLTLELEDRPGALVSMLNALAEKKVNLEYAYAFLSRVRDKAYIVLKCADNATAVEALADRGVQPVCQNELKKIFAKD